MHKLNVISWNVNFKGVKAAKKVCKEMHGLGIDVCGLQEVAKWGSLRGKIYSGLVMLTDTGSDCGFMVSRLWMPAVRNLVFGSYWAALVLSNVVFVDVHLHHGDDRAGDVFHEVQQYIHSLKANNPNVSYHIVALGDFNVELPKIPGITGDMVLHGRSYGAESSVLEWLRSLDLRALNTFATPGNDGGTEQLWTWGQGRKRARKTQIDYICPSELITGYAHSLPRPGTVLHKSDHIPIFAVLEFPSVVAALSPDDIVRSTKGWRPETD